MRVILNTKPLLFQKTGIGYYIYNLYRGLQQEKGIAVYPTITEELLKTFSILSKCSQYCRKMIGDTVLRVSIPVGDLLISRAEAKYRIPHADIYHETNYDVISEGQWKVVATIHDLSFLHYPQYLPMQVLNKCKANLANILKARRYIVMTEAIKKECISFLGIKDELIDVIPLAPSGKYYKLEDGSTRRFISKYTQDDYILYVGTIEPRKNISTLLKAFKLIRDRYKLKLILAGGKGWSYEEVLKMPDKLGIRDDVVFTGYVNEKTILYLYNNAMVFVCPSVYEGFGLPVVEAMSCGVPLIVSDIPSFKEIADDAGLFFNPSDHEELAHKIEDVISSDSLKIELRQKSLQRGNKFSWNKVVAETIQTYKKVMDE